MRTFLCIMLLVATFKLQAQHHHFLYIQADHQQPFYVKKGGSILSSSAEGYLIIPRLSDSAVDLVIGFPEKKYPEYLFRFSGFRKDKGMALKNFGEKGWGLFDYQTTEVIMGEKQPEQAVSTLTPPVPITSDHFTAVLASAIDDPGLLATPLVYISAVDPAPAVKQVGRTVSEPVVGKTSRAPATNGRDAKKTSKETVPLTVGKDAKETSKETMSVTGGKPAADKQEVLQEKSAEEKTVVGAGVEGAGKSPSPLAEGSKPKSASINLIETKTMAEGIEMLFVDPAGHDTITVVIPRSAEGLIVNKPLDTIAISDVVGEKTPETVIAKTADTIVSETLVAASQKPGDTLRVVAAAPVHTATQGSTAAPARAHRTNCIKMAADKDVAAVRKRMVGIKDEDEMVAVALKDFKLKCYSSEQIKAVSFVFTRDEGRYKLIDAAYPYVFDPGNYQSLEPLLSDKYFIHRFRALIQQ